MDMHKRAASLIARHGHSAFKPESLERGQRAQGPNSVHNTELSTNGLAADR